MKKRLTFLILASALICSCSGEATKQYDPYANREIEATNIYSGDGKDFHLHGWYGSSFGVFDVTENDNIIQASYTKEKDYEYANLYTTVQGRFADFEYINIKAKGTLGKAIAFRMYYGESESETNNVLGNDVSFSLSEQFETYSLKVKDIYKTRMDLLTRVCIFPEIGVAASGKFEFSDVWFSKAIPEGSSLKNEGVDNGDIKVNVNGWTTDAWTQYTLYALGNKTGVKYSRAAEYALIQKDITIGEEDAMSFKFQNVKFGTKYSITCIRFSLRGDVLRHVSEDVPYPYDLYYESDLYHYDNTNPEEVQPDENGVVSLKFSLKAAIDAIGEHHANGYHLALMIESHPEDDRKYINYRNGEMIIEEVSLFVDEKKEFDVDGWSSEDWTHYSISKVENDVVVAYEQTAEYGFIQKTLELTANDNAINFSFKNIDSSVKDIHFILRGDFKEHVKPEGKEEYDLFHESEMYHYSLNKDFEYQADANGVITVKIPLNDAIKAIGENNKEGYRLVLNIDSHPDDKVDYKSAKGTMNIIETKIYHDEWKELEIDDWSTEEWSTYYIRNIDNDITVQYKKVTKSQTVKKEITLKENENAATFSFKNIDNSVSNIRFMLRGDIKEHVKPENGDEYDLYYESEIYRYSIDKDFEVEPDENGVISIKMPLMDALDYIGENNKNGLKFDSFFFVRFDEHDEF